MFRRLKCSVYAIGGKLLRDSQVLLSGPSYCRYRTGLELISRSSNEPVAAEGSTVIHVASSWLQQFAVPVEIQELQSSQPQRTSTPTHVLFSADIPIVVCNPVTTPISKLIADPSLPLSHANAVLVIVTTPQIPLGTWKHLTQSLPKTLTTVLVDPARAISAVQTLDLDASSPIAVQRYQDDFTGSRIAELTAVLVEKVSAASQSDIVRLSEVTAREQVRSSLDACCQILKKADADVSRVVSGALSLRDEVAELEARIGPEVLGAANGGGVAAAMAEAKKRVKIVVDKLTWWRCIWRVDDVGDALRIAVDKAWCRGLEDQVRGTQSRSSSSQFILSGSTAHLP